MGRVPNPETGRPQIWRVMNALQDHYGGFTSRALVDVIGDMHRKTVENYLAFLLSERVVAIAATSGDGARKVHTYRLDQRGEAPPFRAEGLGGQRQQALWTTMRALRTFRASELAVAASTEAMPIARETASGFAADLLRAGYLADAGRAPDNSRAVIYRLLPARNTGPRAPIIMRSEQACFDLNLMRVVNVNSSIATGRAA